NSDSADSGAQPASHFGDGSTILSAGATAGGILQKVRRNGHRSAQSGGAGGGADGGHWLGIRRSARPAGFALAGEKQRALAVLFRADLGFSARDRFSTRNGSNRSPIV